MSLASMGGLAGERSKTSLREESSGPWILRALRCVNWSGLNPIDVVHADESRMSSELCEALGRDFVFEALGQKHV